MASINTYQKTVAYQKHVAQRRVSKPIRIKKIQKSYQNISKRIKTYQNQNHDVAIEIPFFMIIMLIIMTITTMIWATVMAPVLLPIYIELPILPVLLPI